MTLSPILFSGIRLYPIKSADKSEIKNYGIALYGPKDENDQTDLIPPTDAIEIDMGRHYITVESNNDELREQIKKRVSELSHVVQIAGNRSDAGGTFGKIHTLYAGIRVLLRYVLESRNSVQRPYVDLLNDKKVSIQYDSKDNGRFDIIGS